MKLVSYEEAKAQPCKPVNFGDEGGIFYRPDPKGLASMEEILRATPVGGGLSGVGLAAPQVGIFKRFFLIDFTAFKGPKYWVFNPTLEVLGKRTERNIEACLSLPGQRFLVERPKTVKLSGFDENGKPFTWAACQGVLARVIQHEMDHLRGVCIKDHAEPIETPEQKLAAEAAIGGNA